MKCQRPTRNRSSRAAPRLVIFFKLVTRYQRTLTGAHAFIEAVAVGDPTPDPSFAANEKPHRFRWRAEVYAVTYEPKLETDVQDDYISSLERHGNQVWIVSERGHRYALDVTSHRVSPR